MGVALTAVQIALRYVLEDELAGGCRGPVDVNALMFTCSRSLS